MITAVLQRWVVSTCAVLLLGAVASGVSGQQVSRVRAVLFYSPTCPHCHQVMTVDLPPLMREYGDRLQIVAVSTATPEGSRLYGETVRVLGIPEERLGVPTLIVGSTVLVGSGEIPAQLPGLVRQALAGSGVNWPAIAAVRELLQAQGLIEVAKPEPAGAPAGVAADPATDTAKAGGQAAAAGRRGSDSAPQRSRPEAARPDQRAPAQPASVEAALAPASPPVPPPEAASTAASQQPPQPASPDATSMTDSAGAAAAAGEAGTPVGAGLLDLTAGGVVEVDMGARFRTDPVGNTVAVAVLFGMLLALGAVAAAVAGRLNWRALPEWLTPVLALLGLGVAVYLSFVEVTGAMAVCGPVGNCNTVQQSPYARVAGVVPVGLLGVVGYVLLLAAWVVAVAGPARHGPFARVVLWGAALLGTVFSVYLTFLEPFVIGATCAWCVTSALVITLLLLQSTPTALAVRDSRSAAG
jgi:uncharacterized membrane protein